MCIHKLGSCHRERSLQTEGFGWYEVLLQMQEAPMFQFWNMTSQWLYQMTLPETVGFKALSMASFRVSKKKYFTWTFLVMLLKCC